MYNLARKSFLFLSKNVNDFIILGKYIIHCIRYYKSIQRVEFGLPIEQLVDTVLHKWESILRPIQVTSEITLFLKLIKRDQPITILEIGTANGGTLFLFSRTTNQAAHIISVDLPIGFMGHLYSIVRLFFFKTIPLSGQKLNLVRADSQQLKTKERIEKILQGKQVDLLYIDADHSYEGVKKDFTLYSQLVKPDGIIAFHDIVYHPPGTVTHLAEVDRFWNEIKTQYKYAEIVENWRQWWAGIGLLTKATFNHQSVEEVCEFLQIPIPHYPNHGETFFPIILEFSYGSNTNFFDKTQPREKLVLNIPLYNERPISFIHHCQVEKLCRIDCFLGTYKRKNQGRVILDVYEQPEMKDRIRQTELDASTLLDNAYASFEFEPISDSYQKDFYISLVFWDGEIECFPGLWYSREIRNDDIRLLH